ncbi:MAG: 2-oxo acid dehydrogenase subunit E2 [Deltaproteobacteria bacterium]|nr:2-oxo acid dehydrogenase subunit E2 [Deltaproteobacteria bacterium]
MMKVDMVMPQMGESIAEATVSKWRKNVGDRVEKDEVILEISTDKVDSEIPSPASGILTEILFKEQDVVPVKTKIAVIDTAGGAAATPAAPAPAAKPELRAVPSPAPAAPRAAQPTAAPVAAASHAKHSDSDRFYSPLVKSLAEKHGIPLAELDSLQGSGQGGRVNKEDLLAYIQNRGSQPAATMQTAVNAPSFQAAPAVHTASRSTSAPAGMPNMDWGDDGTKVVPMDNMRQAIADHMVRSKHTSPHVYSMQEVDVTAISKWRAKHKNEFLKREGFNLSFTPFFLEAAVRGLVEFPYVNCSLDGKKIILKKHVNLGCAVALGNSGLIVPVIKRAEEKNFVGLARSLNDLALRARNKKLLPDDVAGGSFTVTNPGVFGTIIGTPIINQPQVAILCLGAIVKRPVVIDDMIAIREMCYLTLSYDHRIVDGSLGGQYLAFVRNYLENWDSERTLA